MAPPALRGAPSAAQASARHASFGSFDESKAAFRRAGTARFGSGWVWLIVDANGKLAITSTPNQDNPLMDVAETRGTPLLGNAVWEHAYYLRFQNRRADYLDSWWQVVNWAEVSRRYAEAANKRWPRRRGGIALVAAHALTAIAAGQSGNGWIGTQCYNTSI